MTGSKRDDLETRRLASLDARRGVLEHEDVPRGVLQAETLAAEEVARRIGLAILDGLGGDEVLRLREGEDGERDDGGRNAGAGLSRLSRLASVIIITLNLDGCSWAA